MTKFSNKFKKPLFLAHFWPSFPILGQKKIVQQNAALSRTTSYKFLAPCQISEKPNDTIPRKRLDRRTEGRTDFYRTLPDTTGGPINFDTNLNFSVKRLKEISQSAFTCSKLTIEILEQGVKYVQS